jgi:hypothetical protein
MKNNINYPQPDNQARLNDQVGQGSRKNQLEASAKAIIISVLMIIAFAIGAVLWNNRHYVMSFLNY